ncbi:MAG: TatD family deoxyribonuclease [Lachnospiraceae bacterium]|nr:TatD family deoxyribonuclease [Lachnospiraceae bacterium]
MIFETHAHYDDKAFDLDREELLQQLPEEGIKYVVNVAANMEGSRKNLEIVNKYDYIYGTVGVHPSDTEELNEETYKELEELSNNDKIIAVGEIGLDYYWDEPDRSIQKKWFERQIDLSKRINKPIVVHSRDAAKDTLDVIKATKAYEVGGVIHCFSYGVEIAREYLNMGYYIGVGGVVTFKNGKKLKEVVEYAPLDRIVLETDCPYLAPMPFRGKRNDSTKLQYVIEEIAVIKNITPEEVKKVTYNNAINMYKLNM